MGPLKVAQSTLRNYRKVSHYQQQANYKQTIHTSVKSGSAEPDWAVSQRALEFCFLSLPWSSQAWGQKKGIIYSIWYKVYLYTIRT